MELRVGPEDAGARLDAFLAAPLGSRARAQRLIEAGAVRVDGAATLGVTGSWWLRNTLDAPLRAQLQLICARLS